MEIAMAPVNSLGLTKAIAGQAKLLSLVSRLVTRQQLD